MNSGMVTGTDGSASAGAAVRQAAEPRHLRAEELRIAALQAVGAQDDHRAPEGRALAPPVQQALE